MDTRKKLIISCISLILALFATHSSYSAISAGQVAIINGLANDTGSGTSSTASPISVQVSDSVGICSPAKAIAFNGLLIIKWDAKKTHSSTQCTGITSVSITPLKRLVGSVSTIIYDATTLTTVPAITATSAINYLAPTTPVGNLALLVTGTGVPSSLQGVSSTTWGINTAAVPVFNAMNGSLTTVGIPGGRGLAGAQAERLVRRYGIIPYYE